VDSFPSPEAAEPVDPDVDLSLPAQRGELSQRPGPLLAAIAVGGAVGACGRYGAALLWPTAAGSFPVTTLVVNVLGCAAIGLLMVTVVELGSAHPLVRPFLGTGVLGGFTTFSTYAVDVERLVDDGRAGLALAYLALTVTAALGAVWLSATATRRVVAMRRTR
jgi:CrcB protein